MIRTGAGKQPYGAINFAALWCPLKSVKQNVTSQSHAHSHPPQEPVALLSAMTEIWPVAVIRMARLEKNDDSPGATAWNSALSRKIAFSESFAKHKIRFMHVHAQRNL